MNETRTTRYALLAALSLLLLLNGCGGGGGGDSAAATASALTLPVAPASEGETLVQARYQPQVRELLSQPGGPQLLQRDADGTLHFSAPTGATAGQVLIVAGRAYWVTAVDAAGLVLSTRVPELGEVFASLRVKAQANQATPAALMADERRRAIGASLARQALTANSTIDFKTDLGSLGPVGISYKGQLGMTLTLDLDYSADTGFKTLSLVGDGLLTQTLTVQVNTGGTAANAVTGIELTRYSYAIPQTLGLVKIDLPIVLQAQASGDAKLTMPLVIGDTRLRFDLHWDASAKQLAGTASLDNSAQSGAPVAPTALVTAAESLGLNIKVGPDVQLKVLDTVLPLSASLRVNAGLKAQLVSNGQRNCVGWAATVALEGSAKAKLGGGLEAQQQLISPSAKLGEGGDLALCDAAPAPAPAPTPSPSPAPAPTVDGLALLPLPAGAQLLSGYRLALADDAWAPDQSGAWNSPNRCFDSPVIGHDATGLEVVVGTLHYCGHTLQPQVLLPDGSRIDTSTAAYQSDWIPRFTDLGTARCAAVLDAPQGLGLTSPPDPRQYTRRFGEMSTTPLLIGPAGLLYTLAPTATRTDRISVVCQMVLTERSSGQQVYLRSAVWTSAAGAVGVSDGVIWTGLAY